MSLVPILGRVQLRAIECDTRLLQRAYSDGKHRKYLQSIVKRSFLQLRFHRDARRAQIFPCQYIKFRLATRTDDASPDFQALTSQEMKIAYSSASTLQLMQLICQVCILPGTRLK